MSMMPTHYHSLFPLVRCILGHITHVLCLVLLMQDLHAPINLLLIAQSYVIPSHEHLNASSTPPR